MREKFDHMSYLESMEVVDQEIMDQVLEKTAGYEQQLYTAADVRTALEQENVTAAGFGALLSKAAEPFLEEMAKKAKHLTKRYFGTSVSLFTPLYIANYCENHCVYCGFHCHNNIKRGRLSLDDIDKEYQAISATGLKEILILTGESRVMSDVEYIGEAVSLARKYFTTIGIEIYPLNSKEYAYLHQCGADFVSVYQETYHTDRYEELHKAGPKRSFPYRFQAQERALKGGFRGVAFGALLGLGNFRSDGFATGLHAYYVQQKYPHAEISFSPPRLRPYKNEKNEIVQGISEAQLLQVILAYRLFLPFAGITISTRERAGFRDNVIGLCATKMSAGVKTGVGGHEEEAKGDEQFQIADERSVEEIHQMITEKGLQPVYRDTIFVMGE